MSARQKESSDKRAESFEKIKTNTGSFGRLEITRGNEANGRALWRLEGEVKGHVVSLDCDSEWGPVAGGRLNNARFFAGTVDGEDLTMSEARSLWVKYSGMAFNDETKPQKDVNERNTSMNEIVSFLLE